MERKEQSRIKSLSSSYLKAQLRALNKCIKHWEEDILFPVMNDRYGGRSHYEIDCSLCWLNSLCKECILYILSRRRCCIGDRSVWCKFNKNKNIKNAKYMIRFLTEAKNIVESELKLRK